MKRLLFILFLALPTALLASQTEVNETNNAAQNALALLDQADYSSSWDKADELVKKAVTKSQWQQALTQVRSPLGKVMLREQLSSQAFTDLPNAPKGNYLVIQYKTAFANKKSAIETLTLKGDQGKWYLAGYFIK